MKQDLALPILTTNALTKTVSTSEGALTILKGISLEIKNAESVAIIGSSGSGKSTLLGLLAGLDVPSTGKISLNGEDLTAMDEESRAALRSRWVGFVFQTFQLLPGLTALENVMLPAELRGDTDAKAQANSLLDRVGLSHRLHHYPKQLSGGEQQRVAIARAFASQPKILFADEPTGNLDSATGDKICDLLFELNSAYDTTLILVTHDPKLAARCRRCFTLEAGEIIRESEQKAA